MCLLKSRGSRRAISAISLILLFMSFLHSQHDDYHLEDASSSIAFFETPEMATAA